MSKIETLIKELRIRVIEYRNYRKGQEVSLHINAVEIALCLAEFYIYDKRQVLHSEITWFKASYYVQTVLENSEWEDISDMYMRLCEYIKEG